MKISTRFLSYWAIATVALSAVVDVVNGADDHQSCACAAQEEGFPIDCSNRGAMTALMLALIANSCDTVCSSEVCHWNFLVIQSHHDYCLEDELPPTLDDTFHIYEDNCEECEITKKYIPGFPDCPTATCTDGSGYTAWAALVANDCENDCSSTICRGNFRVLKVVHDNCPEDTLSTIAETNYHDMEEVCHEDHGCNMPNASSATPLVCEDTSAAVLWSLSQLTVGLVAVAFTSIF